MVRVGARIFLILFGVICAEGAQAPFAELERKLEALRVRWRIPGMAAGVSQSNRVVWTKEFGYRNLETRERVEPTTVFHIASLTKPFASVVLLQLVEAGKLNLHAPVSDFGITLEADQGAQVYHLLSHTSEGTPGERFSYNGNRFGQLDKVIVKASGRTFSELLSERILEPLALTNTCPNPNAPAACALARRDAAAFLQRSAKGYAFDGETPVEYAKHFVTAAGLVSNCEDLLKFSMALDADNLIPARLKEMAWTPARAKNGKSHPYGLGWFIQNWKGRRIVWHYGWDRANASLIVKIPEAELTFVVLANSEALSRKFDLGKHGDVTRSPFAQEFLKRIDSID